MANVLELAAGVPAQLEGDARVLAGSCLHGGLLIQADQDGAGRRVQAEAADLPGADPEPRVISAAQPAADLSTGGGTTLAIAVGVALRLVAYWRNWQLPRGLDWKIGQRAQASPGNQR